MAVRRTGLPGPRRRLSQRSLVRDERLPQRCEAPQCDEQRRLPDDQVLLRAPELRGSPRRGSSPTDGADVHRPRSGSRSVEVTARMTKPAALPIAKRVGTETVLTLQRWAR